MITLSLNQIRAHYCEYDWKPDVEGYSLMYGDNDQIPVSRFLDTNGLKDTIK